MKSKTDLFESFFSTSDRNFVVILVLRIRPSSSASRGNPEVDDVDGKTALLICTPSVSDEGTQKENKIALLLIKR